MKKLLLSVLLMAVPVAISAQFKVKSDGSILVGTNSYGFFPSTSKIKMELYSPLTGTTDNIGLQSVAIMNGTSYSKTAIGVFGGAGNGCPGRNMGVMGYLAGRKMERVSMVQFIPALAPISMVVMQDISMGTQERMVLRVLEAWSIPLTPVSRKMLSL